MFHAIKIGKIKRRRDDEGFVKPAKRAIVIRWVKNRMKGYEKSVEAATIILPVYDS